MSAALADYLPLTGGTLSGKLTLTAGLDLKGTVAEGLRFQTAAPSSIPCVLEQRGRTIIGDVSGDLFYCDGTAWRRVAGCALLCPDPAGFACGATVTDGCGDPCAASGTGLNEGQCAALEESPCGETREDQCQNTCPGGTGTQCQQGETCEDGSCVASAPLGFVSAEGGDCTIDDDWYDCGKDPSNSDCLPPGAKVQETNCGAFYATSQATPLEACRCIISPNTASAELVPGANSGFCTVYACLP